MCGSIQYFKAEKRDDSIFVTAGTYTTKKKDRVELLELTHISIEVARELCRNINKQLVKIDHEDGVLRGEFMSVQAKAQIRTNDEQKLINLYYKNGFRSSDNWNSDQLKERLIEFSEDKRSEMNKKDQKLIDKYCSITTCREYAEKKPIRSHS